MAAADRAAARVAGLVVVDRGAEAQEPSRSGMEAAGCLAREEAASEGLVTADRRDRVAAGSSSQESEVEAMAAAPLGRGRGNCCRLPIER